jgi:hypothetical protein
MKSCSCCKSTKNLDDFPNNKLTKDGKGSICRSCINEKDRVKRRTSGIPEKRTGLDKEKAKQTKKTWRDQRKNKTFPAIFFKTCTRCKKNLSIENYTKDEKTKDGYRNYCKICRSITAGKVALEYRVKNWAKMLVINAKKHSKDLVEIDENFVLKLFEQQKGKCYWFEVPLVPSEIEKYPFQPSIDRINRELGYVKENVVLACYSANIGRNTSTYEIFKEFCDVLLKKESITK